MAQNCYERIPLVNNDDIRLLHVQPSEDGFAYSLETVRLSHAPPYEAVSYAWGTTVRDLQIDLTDGSQLPTTQNLYHALPHLSKVCSTGFLWIDQLCIDQDGNPKEKNDQVMLMGQIYRSCKRTLIWLEETIDPDPQTRHILANSAAGAGGFDIASLLEPLCMREEDHVYQRLWKLAHRTWFSRAWVVQELLLSPDAQAVIGQSLFPMWDLLLTIASFLSTKTPLSTRHAGLQIWALVHARKLHLASNDLKFVNTLYRSIHFNISDNRDRVFAFLGLLREEGVKIIPDYTASVDEVYADAANALISGTGQLAIFETFGPRRSAFNDWTGQWPSWVRDWRDRVTFTHLIYPDTAEIRPQASRGRVHNMKTAEQRNQLFVRGKIITEVLGRTAEAKLKGKDELAYNDFWRDLKAVIPLEEELGTIHHLGATLPDLNVTKESLLRLRIADCSWKRKLWGPIKSFPDFDVENMEELLNAYDLFKPGEVSTEAPPATLREAYTKALQILVNPAFSRSVLVTASGKLGLSGCAEAGDLVAILHGCDMPVLLRKHPSEADRYLFIEVIYLEDAMQGEAVWWAEDEAEELIIV